MLELDCFVRSWLFYCPLSYTFLGFVGIQEFGFWSSIHLLVVSQSCDFVFNFTCIMLQFHCEHVALLFFWFSLLASECSYWRRFAYPMTKDVEVIIQPGVGSHASQWVLLFSRLLVLLGSDLFFCPLSYTSLPVKMCDLPRSHPTQKCDIILRYMYHWFVSTRSVDQPGRF